MPSKPPKKRQTDRIRPFVASCLVFEGSRRFRAYLTDLSTGGARVTCSGPPPAPGAQVSVEVRLGRELSQMHLSAVVKWVRPPEGQPPAHSFGLTFAGLSAEDQQRLETVVQEFRRRAAEVSS